MRHHHYSRLNLTVTTGRKKTPQRRGKAVHMFELWSWRVPFSRHVVLWWGWGWGWFRIKKNRWTFGTVYHIGPVSVYLNRTGIRSHLRGDKW
jgi:hypothetical protein